MNVYIWIAVYRWKVGVILAVYQDDFKIEEFCLSLIYTIEATWIVQGDYQRQLLLIVQIS